MCNVNFMGNFGWKTARKISGDLGVSVMNALVWLIVHHETNKIAGI
jgi:hypothetical protein